VSISRCSKSFSIRKSRAASASLFSIVVSQFHLRIIFYIMPQAYLSQLFLIANHFFAEGSQYLPAKTGELGSGSAWWDKLPGHGSCLCARAEGVNRKSRQLVESTSMGHFWG